ncbi:MAG: PilZ domain-containing protein [Elusimicrobia bacterium]|nr:PilZ domain-containing protein [Candidatus Liberimonas magnetica]
MIENKRKYERHNLEIPIKIQLGDIVFDKTEYLNDISMSGLSFKSKSPIDKETIIYIKIPLLKPVFEAKGKVVWCKKAEGYYNVGIKFIEIADSFKLRMVEQICHIEKYKKEICKNENRQVTGEEAALEWIRKYAKSFPHYK